jgi:hypothetical protein
MLSEITLFFVIFILFIMFANFTAMLTMDNKMLDQLKYILFGLIFALVITSLIRKETYDQVFTNLLPNVGNIPQVTANSQTLRTINYNNYARNGFLVGLETAPTPYLTSDEQAFTSVNCPDIYTSCDSFLATPLSDNETFCNC